MHTKMQTMKTASCWMVRMTGGWRTGGMVKDADEREGKEVGADDMKKEVDDARIEMEVSADDMTIEADDRMEVEPVATPPFNSAAPVSVNALPTSS